MLLELSLLLCAVEAVELEDEETVLLLLAEEATEEELELIELLLDELSWVLSLPLTFNCLVTFDHRVLQ